MNKGLRIILTTFFFMMFISPCTFAGVAFPGPYNVDNGNEDIVQIMHYGDQNFIIETDMDGNLVTQDNEGILRYIIKVNDGDYSLDHIVSDGDGRAVPDEVVNRNTSDDETWTGAVKFLKRTDDVSIFNSEDNLIWFPQPETDPLMGKLSNMDEESYNKSEREETVPLLVVLVDFNDVKTERSAEEWSDAIFDENGINKYFLENSKNNFSFVPAETGMEDAEGVLKVTLPFDRPLYEKQEDERYKSVEPGIYEGSDGRDYRLINDSSLYAYAINAVDEQHEEIDFGKYEKNGDGYLDTNELAVVTIIAGYEASTLADPQGQPASWCHRWAICYFDNGDGSLDPNITQQVTLDGVGLSEHLQVGEILDFTSSIGEEVYTQIGVFCHELAHYFGADDLYDIYYALLNRMNVYYMTLMSDGEWGYTEESPVPGSVPTHIDPLNKLVVGFCEPTEVSESGEYTLYPASSADYNFLMVDTNDENISYMIENRQSMGFDAPLGYMYGDGQNGGIIVWRMNKAIIKQYWDTNEINSVEEDYGFIPVFADGVYSTLPMWSTDSIDIGYYDETAFPDIQFPSDETHYNMILQEESPMIALSVDQNANADGSISFKVIMEDITEKPVLKNEEAFIINKDTGSSVTFQLENISYTDDAKWKVYSSVRKNIEAEDLVVEYDKDTETFQLVSTTNIPVGEYWISVKETGLYESMPVKLIVKDSVYEFTAEPKTLDFASQYTGYAPEEKVIVLKNTGMLPINKLSVTGIETAFEWSLDSDKLESYGDSCLLTVKPTSGLHKGGYNEILTITGITDENRYSIDIPVTFKVKERTSSGNSSSGSPYKGIDADKDRPADDIKQVKFVDVSSDRWSAEVITLFAGKGYVSGVGNGKFEPERKISRAEFVTVLANIFKNDDIKIDRNTNKFNDTPEDSWYYENVLWAVENGITSGIGNNLFGPELSISRQDMAVMTTRAAIAYGKLTEGNKNIAFTDYSDIADYAKEAVILLSKAGVINGMPDGRFAPLESASREQAVAILAKLLKAIGYI